MMETGTDSAIADRCRAGDALNEAELLALDGLNVLSLGMLADEVRRVHVGDVVTYARVFEPEAGTPDEHVAALAAQGVELRLSSPETSLDETAARIARLRTAAGPNARVTGFWLGDLTARKWAPIAAVLEALRGAGLMAIAAAAIDVSTPSEIDAVAAAGLGLGALAVQRMPEERVALVLKARACMTERPWLTAFAPLSREQSVAAPTTGYHDVRMVALSRLALPSVRTIQVDWRQYGPKLAQVALTFGASHLDRVSPIDDPALGPRRGSVEDVRRNIVAAGFTPAEQGATA